jgi:hypothetical protein
MTVGGVGYSSQDVWFPNLAVAIEGLPLVPAAGYDEDDDESDDDDFALTLYSCYRLNSQPNSPRVISFPMTHSNAPSS